MLLTFPLFVSTLLGHCLLVLVRMLAMVPWQNACRYQAAAHQGCGGAEMPTIGPTRRRAGFVAITFLLSIGLAQTVPDKEREAVQVRASPRHRPAVRSRAVTSLEISGQERSQYQHGGVPLRPTQSWGQLPFSAESTGSPADVAGLTG